MSSAGDRADDHELDRVINEAARRLTEGEPDAMAGRVIARLGERSAVWRRVGFVATATAAFAMIVLAIVLLRPFRASRSEGQPPATHQGVVAGQPGQGTQPGEHPPQSAENGSVPVRSGPGGTGRGSVRSGPEEIVVPFALPGLTEPPLVSTSLAIDPIAPAALPAADSIAVPRLEPIAPLAVPSIEDQDDRHD